MWKSKDPWRCLHCSKLNRFNVNCCGDCGGHWEDFMDHTFVPPSQQNKSNSKATRSSNQTSNRQAYASWNYPEPWTGEDEEWDYHSSRSSSPRQRTQSPRQRQEPRRQRKPNQNQRGRGAGKGKNQMKGGAKGKGKGKPAIELPPWTTNATTSTSASAAAPSAGPTKAEVKLMEIVSVLKKKDDPELQTLAKEADVLHHKNATSKLHKAVTIHGDAKTMPHGSSISNQRSRRGKAL